MLLLAFVGCCGTRSNQLAIPVLARPCALYQLSIGWHRVTGDFESQIVHHERSVAEIAHHAITVPSAANFGESAYALAESLHWHTDDRAVDYWARAIAWMDEALRLASSKSPCRRCEASTCGPDRQSLLDGNCLCRSTHSVSRFAAVKRSAEARILAHAPCYGRLDPSSHLLIHSKTQSIHVPVIHRGFAWQPSDFNRLLVIEPPDAPGNLDGLGVPLIVFSPGQSPDISDSLFYSRLLGTQPACQPSDASQPVSFVVPGTPFAATGVINLPISLFTPEADIIPAELDNVTDLSLVFYNPLELNTHSVPEQIAQSPAMPLAYLQAHSQYDPLRVFLNGDTVVDEARLRFFEPYQPGKIPLVFVHGLISDPTTFIEMADAIRADPSLRNRYQIWAFRYPTGKPFLGSAAALRQQLELALSMHSRCRGLDKSGELRPTDPAVIIGHSMGGLIAKMQITDSTDKLWRSVAKVPFEQLNGASENLMRLQNSFFFNASPHISRVIYIATPHRGSPWADRCIGRLSDLLARGRPDDERVYRELINANPGAFSGEFGESFPSSVNLLRPSSRLLQSLASLPSSPQTTVHSIIGNHCHLPLAGPSDGVVPIDSAYVPEAMSTKIVDASHTSIQRSVEAHQELLRILHQHLDELVVDDEAPMFLPREFVPP